MLDTQTVSVRWYDGEQTIVLYTFEDNWTWEDLSSALDIATQMYNSVSHRVDVIADVTRQTHVPKQMFHNWKQMASKMPSNIHLSVVVVSNNTVRLWMQAATNMIPVVRRDFRATETVDEAFAMIMADRAKALQSGE